MMTNYLLKNTTIQMSQDDYVGNYRTLLLKGKLNEIYYLENEYWIEYTAHVHSVLKGRFSPTCNPSHENY